MIRLKQACAVDLVGASLGQEVLVVGLVDTAAQKNLDAAVSLGNQGFQVVQVVENIVPLCGTVKQESGEAKLD